MGLFASAFKPVFGEAGHSDLLEQKHKVANIQGPGAGLATTPLLSSPLFSAPSFFQKGRGGWVLVFVLFAS